MDLKDKLNLLWKYLLLLAVVAFGIVLVVQCPDARRWDDCDAVRHGGMGFMGLPHAGMGHAGNVKVEKQVINGDTTLVVWVDGKKIDNPEEFLQKQKHGFKSGDCYVMKKEDAHGEIMKKEIRVKKYDDDDDD